MSATSHLRKWQNKYKRFVQMINTCTVATLCEDRTNNVKHFFTWEALCLSVRPSIRPSVRKKDVLLFSFFFSFFSCRLKVISG